MPFFKKNHSLHRQKPLKNNTATSRQFRWVSAKALLVLPGGEPGAGGLSVPREVGPGAPTPRFWVRMSAPAYNLPRGGRTSKLVVECRWCGEEEWSGVTPLANQRPSSRRPALQEDSGFGTRRPGHQDDHPLNPRSSLDTDVVRHTETGKAAGSSKPNREPSGGGAEASPSSAQGQSGTAAGRAWLAWALGQSHPEPRRPDLDGPPPYAPRQPSTLCGVPRLRDGQPSPPSSWALKPSPSLPPPALHPTKPLLPSQCRPGQFSCGGGRIRPHPSLPDSGPALRAPPSSADTELSGAKPRHMEFSPTPSGTSWPPG